MLAKVVLILLEICRVVNMVRPRKYTLGVRCSTVVAKPATLQKKSTVPTTINVVARANCSSSSTKAFSASCQ